jgi:hypothetical protein
VTNTASNSGVGFQHRLTPAARLLFRSALVIFLVTIIIGILNGLDVWDPPRKMILTHVHAGTLGWITMSVIGVALLMFGGKADERVVKSGTRLAQGVVGVTVLYVVTFALTTGVFRPIAGTLMLAAVAWALVWVVGRWKDQPVTVPALAMLLALISLVVGAILGVLLGLFIANGSLPGVGATTAANLGGAHPAAMLVGYLILAGTAIAEWRLSSRPVLASESKVGVAVAFGLFVSGLLFNVALIGDVEALVQVASTLEVIGVVAFIARMWGSLKPRAWSGGGTGVFARMSIVYLAVGIGLLVYVVQLLVSGELDPEAGGEGLGVLIAFDHSMFIGVMTNALFAVQSMSRPFDGLQRLIVWGFNVGLAGFLIGLASESAEVKRIFSPVMGVALLVGIYVYLTRRETVPST